MKRERTPIAVGQVRATVKSSRGRTSTIYCHALSRWPLVTPDPKDTL